MVKSRKFLRPRADSSPRFADTKNNGNARERGRHEDDQRGIQTLCRAARAARHSVCIPRWSSSCRPRSLALPLFLVSAKRGELSARGRKNFLDFTMPVNYNSQADKSIGDFLGQHVEMSRSWSSAHDWKSCRGQKLLESSNLSISAMKRIAILTKVAILFSCRYSSIWYNSCGCSMKCV